MTSFEKKTASVKQLIADHPEAADFAPFGEGVSPEWIAKAEQRLGVQFPPSYKWWLNNYHSGSIYGDEVFSIYEMDFDTFMGGDVVVQNESERKAFHLPANHLLIQTNDQAESYFIDLLQIDSDLESPVYVLFAGESQKFANDFLEFLMKKISTQ